MTSFFAHPVAAAVLGALFGAGLIVVSRWSFKLVNPDTGYVGVAAAAVALILRMLLAAGVMFVYLLYARRGFAAFATATLVTFFVLYTVELFRYGGLRRWLRRSRPKGSR